MPLNPSKEGQGVEVYERPEDSIGKQQEPRRQEEEEEEVRRQQQQTKRQQQEHARTTVPAPRKEDLISVSLRRAGSGAGDAALPQIADIVAEFHRSYVTVPGYHKHTSRKVSEWIRACKRGAPATPLSPPPPPHTPLTLPPRLQPRPPRPRQLRPLLRHEDDAHSHWSRAFQPGEVMTPYGGHFISSLTMALAEDSGWYVANWDQAATLPLVQEAGCGFLQGSCDAFAATPNGREVMCSKGEDEGHESCSGDRHTIRLCSGDSGDECRIREVGDKVYVNEDWERVKGHCLDSRNRDAAGGFWGNVFGSESRCMEVVGEAEWELDEDGGFYTTSSPRCVHMQCTADGALELVFGEDVVACPSGETVNVKGMMPEGSFGGRFRKGSRLGPCPDNEAMCSDLLAPGEQLCGGSKCNHGQGQCVDGQCQCRIGYAGADCSLATCTPSSCGPGSSCDPSTGVCDPQGPVTSPSPSPSPPAVTSSPEDPTAAPTAAPTPSPATVTPAPTPGPPDEEGRPPTSSCCVDLAGRGWSWIRGAPVCASAAAVTEEGGCQRKISFAGAESACEAAGARLCTAEELGQKYARRAGCRAKKLRAWTSTECVDKKGRPGAAVAKGANGKGAKCQRKAPKKRRFGLLCCADACANDA